MTRLVVTRISNDEGHIERDGMQEGRNEAGGVDLVRRRSGSMTLNRLGTDASHQYIQSTSSLGGGCGLCLFN